MKIFDIETPKKIEPRVYRQYAKVRLQKGDLIFRAHDREPHRIESWEATELTANRVTTKNGKPRSKWFVIFKNYHYALTASITV